MKEMEEYQKTIMVDFDNTIHKYSKGWHDGTIYDGPVEGAIEAIQALIAAGYKVVVFTALSKRGKERNFDIQDWLRKYGVHVPVTNTKRPARAFIDDRGIRFTNWKDMRRYFL